MGLSLFPHVNCRFLHFEGEIKPVKPQGVGRSETRLPLLIHTLHTCAHFHHPPKHTHTHSLTYIRTHDFGCTICIFWTHTSPSLPKPHHMQLRQASSTKLTCVQPPIHHSDNPYCVFASNSVSYTPILCIPKPYHDTPTCMCPQIPFTYCTHAAPTRFLLPQLKIFHTSVDILPYPPTPTPDTPHTLPPLPSTHPMHAYIPSPTSTTLHTHISHPLTHATLYTELPHSRHSPVIPMFQDRRPSHEPPQSTPESRSLRGPWHREVVKPEVSFPEVTACFPGGQALA